jgi:NSS family neurotransmitter:Na+ symporter
MLMMYYTTITGWMFYYLYKTVTGGFAGMAAKDIGSVLGGLVSDPVTMTGYMALAVVLGFGVCYLGVEAGVERITKFMMTCLLFLMIALAVNSVLLPGGKSGLAYFLQPDFSRLTK